jgi:hypothetical protein
MSDRLSPRGTARSDAAATVPHELLDKQLARDKSGELRDQMLDELALAAQDIEAALGAKPDDTAARVLGNLLRAVRTSERVVTEGWQSLQK